MIGLPSLSSLDRSTSLRIWLAIEPADMRQAAQEAHQENQNAGMSPLPPGALQTPQQPLQIPMATNKMAAGSPAAWSAWADYVNRGTGNGLNAADSQKQGSCAPACMSVAPSAGTLSLRSGESISLGQLLASLSASHPKL